MADQFRTKIIVNPHSSNGRTGHIWSDIESAIRPHLPVFDHEFTKVPLDATRIARESLKAGYEMIVMIGGDGSLNEAVNGFFENGEPVKKDAVLGLVNMGTGGDFRKTLGIPKEFMESARFLAGLDTTDCDVGRTTLKDHSGSIIEKYFINITDFGMGGDVVYRVNSTTKAFGGFASFLAGMLRSQIHYRNQSVALEIDGKQLGERKIKNVFIANGQYCGGGMRVAKNAALNNGLFEIIIMGDMNPIESTVNIKKLYSGDIIELKNKVEYYRAKQIKADSAERVLIDMDGEQPGMLPFTATVLPSAIKVKTLNN